MVFQRSGKNPLGTGFDWCVCVWSLFWRVGRIEEDAAGWILRSYANNGSTHDMPCVRAVAHIVLPCVLCLQEEIFGKLVKVGERIGVHVGSALELPDEERQAVTSVTATATANVAPLEEREGCLGSPRAVFRKLDRHIPHGNGPVRAACWPAFPIFNWTSGGRDAGGRRSMVWRATPSSRRKQQQQRSDRGRRQ